MLSAIVTVGMHEITTSIGIDAPADTVWAVLTDFAAYPEWNPRTRIEGRPEAGQRLRVAPGPDAEGMPTFRPRVLVADGRELLWRGRLYLPRLFDGEHRFLVEEDGDGSRLVQSERFTGLLVGPLMRRYGADTEAGFHAVNAALKARTEALTAESGTATAA